MILDRMNQRVDERRSTPREARPLSADGIPGHGAEPLPSDGPAHPGLYQHDKIANAKKESIEHLNAVERMSPAQITISFDKCAPRTTVRRRQPESAQLYTAGNIDDAMKLHLGQEHPVSHEAEARCFRLNADAVKDMREQRTLVTADQGLLGWRGGGVLGSQPSHRVTAGFRAVLGLRPPGPPDG